MAEEFPHVSQPLQDIDPLLALHVSAFQNEGEHRLRQLRPVVRACNLSTMSGKFSKNAATSALILRSIVSTSVTPDNSAPRVCLVTQRYKRIHYTNIKTLAPEERASCIPIAFSADLAFPLSHFAPALIVDTGVGKQRAIVILTRVSGDDANRVDLQIHSADTPRTVSTSTENVPSVLLDRLFSRLPDALLEEANLAKTLVATPHLAKADAPPRWSLPRELGEVFAQILQDHIRLHVLLNGGAATDAAALSPILLNNPTCSVAFKDTPQQKFMFTSWLHGSSSACCCSAHGHRAEAVGQAFLGITISLSACGREMCSRSKRCPLHSSVEPQEGDPVAGRFCLFGMKLSVACLHKNTSSFSQNVLKTDIVLPEHTIPALLALVSAALYSTHTPLNRAAVARSMREKLEEADTFLRELKPGVSPVLDTLAIQAMRANLFSRGSLREGVPTMRALKGSPPLTNDVKRLRYYTRLFRPVAGSKRRRHATPKT
jgi:hypothetical protein